jgi:hypothetical protein
MDPKGKGMVINDKEKEKETLYVDEPRWQPTNSGSNNKRKDGKKKRHIKKIIYYDSDASFSSPITTTRPRKRKQLIRIILSIILACRTIQILIYCPFHVVNPPLWWRWLLFLEP